MSFIRQGLAAVLNAFKLVLLHKVQPGGDPAYHLAWKNYIEASLTSSHCLEPCQSIMPQPTKANGKITFDRVWFRFKWRAHIRRKQWTLPMKFVLFYPSE